MNRPPLEMADIVRAQGRRFIENNRPWLHWIHQKVLLALLRCRTAALGGHRDQCPGCGYQAISYNSCRNRHCPKCQTAARRRWLAARQQELLAVGYFHLVFDLASPTLPAGTAKQESPLRLVVPRQCRDSAAGLFRPPPLGSRGRLRERLAHLGSESPAPSPYPLPHPCRGTLARSHPLDSSSLPLLAPGPGAQSGLPG